MPQLKDLKSIRNLQPTFVGLVSELIYVDPRDAFDAVNHNILLERPECAVDIKETALGWFKSNLSNRFR